jgi:hypothetical protein
MSDQKPLVIWLLLTMVVIYDLCYQSIYGLRPDGSTRKKWRILDGKVESGLISDSKLQGGNLSPVSIKDRVSCALL